MRNPLKRQPRPAEKPTLRERAATLKSGLTRLLARSAVQGEADQHRRALVAGSVAAVIPLPVLSRAAAPAVVTPTGAPAHAALLPAPHPDRALLDLAAAYSEALKAETLAYKAAETASDLIKAVTDRRPVALVPSVQDWRIVHNELGAAGRHPKPFFMYVFISAEAFPDNHQRWRYAWTGEGLRAVIAKAVPALGRGGQTPHVIRRWRALLPIADAFDAEVAAVRTLTDCARLSTEAADARDKAQALRCHVLSTVATTPEGLAVQVRLLAEAEWMKQGGAFTILMQSAAAVAGVTLPESDFNAAAWAAAWKDCGGRVEWIQRRYGREKLAICSPDVSNRDPAAKAVVRQLEHEHGKNGALIDRWLRANR